MQEVTVRNGYRKERSATCDAARIHQVAESIEQVVSRRTPWRSPRWNPWRSFFFFSSRRRHTRLQGDWSSDVCSSDLAGRRVPWCRRSSARGLLAPRAGRRSHRRGPRRGDAGVSPAVGPRPRQGDVERGGDRESVVEGKSVDLGGGRIIKKKKRRTSYV